MSHFADKLGGHRAEPLRARPQSASRFAGREFLRLVWKELHTLRPFVSVVALVMATLCGGLWSWQPEISPETRLLLLGLPQLVAILFSIGSGTLLFSQETELGTLDFLRGMGISPRRVVNAKLLAGSVSLVLLAMAIAFGSWQPALTSELPVSRLMLGLMSCGMGLTVLLWTSLWSMTIRRELPTVVGGLGGVLLLKPFVDQWSELGLLTFLGVVALGLLLLCQAAAASWMNSERRWWFLGAPASSDRATKSVSVGGWKQAIGVGVGSKRDSIVIGSTIAVGIGLWLLLMLCFTQATRAGQWPTTLEMIWSMVIGAMLGWWPLRSARSDNREPLRPLAAWLSPAPWLLVWWLLSMGLWCAYRTQISFDLAFAECLQMFRGEVLPWSIVTVSVFRWSARLCAARWWTWPLALLPLGASWSVWWLAALLGEPAWLGLLMMSLLFEGMSVWHWQTIRRGRSLRRANLFAISGTVGLLAVSWGLFNDWRVAEVPLDWTGGSPPAPLPAPTDAEIRELSQQRAVLLSLLAQVQTAPNVTWPDGREVQCFHNDWRVIDGDKPWSDVTEPTRRWVERHEELLATALRGNSTSPTTEDSRLATTSDFVWPSQLVVIQFQRLLDLAARRSEQQGQLDDVWRLQRVGVWTSQLQDWRDPTTHHTQGNELSVTYRQFDSWIAHPKQTSPRLKQAIADVLADGDRVALPEVLLPRLYEQVRKTHRQFADSDFTPDGNWSWERWLFRRLCPSEQRREDRIFNGLEGANHAALASLRPVSSSLSATRKAHVTDHSPPIPPRRRPFWLVSFAPKILGTGITSDQGAVADLMARTPRLQFPKKDSSLTWSRADISFLSVENQRRNLLLSLALRAFELDHRRAATSTAELVPDYLPQQPVEVASGRDLWKLRQEQAAGQFQFHQQPTQ